MMEEFIQEEGRGKSTVRDHNAPRQRRGPAAEDRLWRSQITWTINLDTF